MAGGGKETPRQKMIGMMYLVLTALLAMNVSKDILMTFVTVNESLERSNSNFTKNSLKIMDGFKDAAASTPAAKPYYDKALEAEKLTSSLYAYIEKLKHELIAHTAAGQVKGGGGDTLRLRFVDAKDDVNNPTHLLIGTDEKHPATGETSAAGLKEEMDKLHDKLLAMVEGMQKDTKTRFLNDDYETLKKKIEAIKPSTEGQTENGVPVTWEILNFYHAPLAGVVTYLSKLQTDIKIVEAELISQFSAASGKRMVKFDKLAAKVVAPSSYIQSGQKYSADIFIAASSSDFKEENMQVIVNPTSYDSVAGKVEGGINVPLVDGMGKFEQGTSGQGEQKYSGVIRFKQPDGTYKLYKFEQSYMVAQQAIAVSADQMNVFYVGVPNPVSVSAAGVSPTDMVVTPTGGGVRVTQKGPGQYEYNFTTPGECTINVSAKTKDGTKPQGSKKFRVKSLPPPVASVGGVSGSVDMKKSQLATIGGVGANAPGFDFKANFVVLSFEVTGTIKGQTKVASCQGNGLSADAKAILSQAGPGSKIFIDQIKVKGPDGKITSNAPGVTIRVKG
jgi:gliding motility-associated protein GldM